MLSADLAAIKMRPRPTRLRGPMTFTHNGGVVTAKVDGFWNPSTSIFSGTFHGKQTVTGATGKPRTLVISGRLDLVLPEGVPATTVPATTVPATTVPATTVPATTTSEPPSA